MESVFTLKDGRSVTIEVDEYSYEVDICDSHGRTIGRFEFGSINDDSALLLKYAMLDLLGSGYLHQGIGTEVLRIIGEQSGLPIYARDDDGIRRDDGSHLTGQARAFVAAMKEKGLIQLSSLDKEASTYE